MFIFVSVLLVFTERVNGRETILHDGQVHHVEDEFAELRSKKMLKRPKLLWRGAAVIYSINSSIGKKYFAHATLGKTGGRTFLQVHRRYWTKSMLLHELGHTLSLHHEHQRSDGDLYLDTLEENIRKNRKSKLPTQQLKSGERWGAPTKLSDGDVRRIQDLYRCIGTDQKPNFPFDVSCSFDTNDCGFKFAGRFFIEGAWGWIPKEGLSYLFSTESCVAIKFRNRD
ncbi:unnamed protein product [Bemisia tabaci]|uniref:Metalloendopeptidase n=1 Tax=Bemisia tabaci TaxID=7038 RepID=A0A9P0F5C9_BEMTA|nr:unnamed protein product [Bemisia tabaci]